MLGGALQPLAGPELAHGSPSSWSTGFYATRLILCGIMSLPPTLTPAQRTQSLQTVERTCRVKSARAGKTAPGDTALGAADACSWRGPGSLVLAAGVMPLGTPALTTRGRQRHTYSAAQPACRWASASDTVHFRREKSPLVAPPPSLLHTRARAYTHAQQNTEVV